MFIFQSFSISDILVILKYARLLMQCFSSQVVTLKGQLASLKAQASKRYATEFSMPGNQQDNIYENKFMAYQHGEGDGPHPAGSCTSAKNESQQCFSSDTMTCPSTQSLHLRDPYKYTPDCTASFNSCNDPSRFMFSLSMQDGVHKNGYNCTDDFELLALAYLN